MISIKNGIETNRDVLITMWPGTYQDVPTASYSVKEKSSSGAPVKEKSSEAQDYSLWRLVETEGHREEFKKNWGGCE